MVQVQLYVHLSPLLLHLPPLTSTLTHPRTTTDVLSAGLDSGFVIGTIIVFFCLQFPRNGTIGESTILSWWGNNGAFQTADVAGTPLHSMPPGVPFGPTTWK